MKMSIIIPCGFQEVDISCFRRKTLNKGKKLLKSFHVSEVTETVRGDDRLLSGKVIRETPGVASARKNENIYFPQVMINKNRMIDDAKCTCIAGLGFCKHAAAICLYINEEYTLSKTDQPMLWKKPSEVQLKKYHKGCTIASLFEVNEEIKPFNVFKQDVVHVSEEHMSETSMQAEIMRAEVKHLENIEKNIALKKNREAELRTFLKDLFSFQESADYKLYHCYKCEFNVGAELKLKIVNCNYHLMYPDKLQKVHVSKEEAIDFALMSTNQSESSLWYSMRFARITSSTRAHRINLLFG